ncbi:hypothetical protein LXL04_026603 [Taraxacum kok-saghyz]
MPAKENNKKNTYVIWREEGRMGCFDILEIAKGQFGGTPVILRFSERINPKKKVRDYGWESPKPASPAGIVSEKRLERSFKFVVPFLQHRTIMAQGTKEPIWSVGKLKRSTVDETVFACESEICKFYREFEICEFYCESEICEFHCESEICEFHCESEICEFHCESEIYESHCESEICNGSLFEENEKNEINGSYEIGVYFMVHSSKAYLFVRKFASKQRIQHLIFVQPMIVGEVWVVLFAVKQFVHDKLSIIGTDD